jgi:5-hydroxyisourate hydrolase
MNPESIGRRDVLVTGAALAAAALAAAPKPAAAQAPGGRVTAHVLDLYSGTPANGIRIDLVAVDGGTAKVLKSVTSNADGRPPEGPLVTPDGMKTGRYQAIVHVGDYYRKIGAKLPGGYHTKLILEFDIYDPMTPHHLPFQITPWTQSASVLPG